MKPVMPKMSKQLAVAAFASVLAMSALALAVPVSEPGYGSSAGLGPATVELPSPHVPALPVFLPR
jgi:hypothetical protein